MLCINCFLRSNESLLPITHKLLPIPLIRSDLCNSTGGFILDLGPTGDCCTNTDFGSILLVILVVFIGSLLRTYSALINHLRLIGALNNIRFRKFCALDNSRLNKCSVTGYYYQNLAEEQVCDTGNIYLCQQWVPLGSSGDPHVFASLFLHTQCRTHWSYHVVHYHSFGPCFIVILLD